MQELQRYSSEVDNLLARGPKWLDFAIFSEQMVSTAINKNLELLEKYNRHYNKQETLVHTHVILSTGWLWQDGQTCPHDYSIGWGLIQNLLIEKFSYYQLLFSENAVSEFCVDGFYYKECIPHFWIIINTRRNDVKKKTKNAMEDRIIGTLMGQAVGDALGARYKFSTPSVASKNVNQTNEILGGGPFKVNPGYLGITELAVYLAKSGASLQKIIDWYNTEPPPFSEHLETIGREIDLHDLILGLMVPFAISNTDPMTFLSQVVKDPITVDMAQVFWVSLKNAIAGDSRKDIWRKAILQASSEPVKGLLYSSTDSRGETFLQCAFYELLNGKNIQDSLRSVISLGGDTDIRGAVCGALLGGLYGYSEIPSDWSKVILNSRHVRQKRFSDINTHDLISLALRLSKN